MRVISIFVETVEPGKIMAPKKSTCKAPVKAPVSLSPLNDSNKLEKKAYPWQLRS